MFKEFEVCEVKFCKCGHDRMLKRRRKKLCTIFRRQEDGTVRIFDPMRPERKEYIMSKNEARNLKEIVRDIDVKDD